MPNDYFQFKQFRITQANTAMKVSTDACIQGAILANYLSKNTNHSLQVLDIGTGTGLLSLMIAQQNPTAEITAIDINENAIMDAKENFKNSIWYPQIKVEKISIEDLQTTNKFNAIICNPPFFSNHLKNENANKSQARHDDFLSKEILANSIGRLLANNGKACVLYPHSEWEACLDIFKQHHLFLEKIYYIQPNQQKVYNRVIAIFSKELTTPLAAHIVIYNQDKSYTTEFIALMNEYYLKL